MSCPVIHAQEDPNQSFKANHGKEVSDLYNEMREECDKIEDSILEAQEKVMGHEEKAFTMSQQSKEVLWLQDQQNLEKKEKEEAFDKMINARIERKRTKHFQRQSNFRIKSKDISIVSQAVISRQTNLNRLIVSNKRKAFDALLSHLEAVHEKQRKQMLAAQARKLQYLKQLNELQTRNLRQEERMMEQKKFQVRQNDRIAINKRLFEQLGEVQATQIRHLKAEFDLELTCFEEMEHLKANHHSKQSEMDERHYTERYQEKERLISQKEQTKLSELKEKHALEMKRLTKDHRITLRQLKMSHEQKLASRNQSNAGSQSASPGTQSRGPPSKIASRSGSNDSLDSYASSTATSPNKSSIKAAMALGKVELDEIDDENQDEVKRTKVELSRLMEGMMIKQEQEKQALNLVIQKELNELQLAIEARKSEMQDVQYREMEALETSHKDEIDELRKVQDKQIAMEDSVHEAEVRMLIERRILNSVLETVVDGIINITPKGIIIRFNAAAAKMFGYTPEEVIGQNIKMLMPENFAVLHDSFLANYMNTGVKKIIGSGRRVQAVRKTGELFPCFVSVSEVKESGEHMFTGIVRDLTEQVRMEEEAEKAEKENKEHMSKLIAQLDYSKQKADGLLKQMLPPTVSTALMEGKSVAPEQYNSATIFFLDVVGFTTICSGVSPMETVSLLNGIYTIFDDIIEQYDVYKVETIGDSYMVVSGLPNRNGERHVGEIATMALHILSKVHSYTIPALPNTKLRVRIGINTGPVVAGVVGNKMPRYCLFGDTVNTASRMESSGEPMKIQISQETHKILAKTGGYKFSFRGDTQIKGKGSMQTYWLTGKEGFPYELPSQ